MVSIQTFLKAKNTDLFTSIEDSTTAFTKDELDGDFQSFQEACTTIESYYKILTDFLDQYKKGFKE